MTIRRKRSRKDTEEELDRIISDPSTLQLRTTQLKSHLDVLDHQEIEI